MVSSCSPKMPKTIEAYQQLAQRDLELIEAQRDEIAKLKGTVNDLWQRIKRPAPCANVCEAKAFEIEIRGWRTKALELAEKVAEYQSSILKSELVYCSNDAKARAIEDAVEKCRRYDENLEYCDTSDLLAYAQKLR